MSTIKNISKIGDTLRRNNNLFDRFGQTFCQEAQKSPIAHQLAAGVIKDKKLVGKVCCNTLSNNDCCGSLHAEANAITAYFGRNVSFDNHRNKWYLKDYYSQCEKT
jgi:hypothetical protein